jgi:hypothetical protein
MYLSLHRSTSMFRVTFWVQLLLLFFMLRQSDEFGNEVSCIEENILQRCKHDILVSQCYLIGLQYNIIMRIKM